MNLFIKSIFDGPSPKDGKRFLVELFWPRGVWKQRAELEDWLRGAAPKRELLAQWKEHDIDFGAFKKEYIAQLERDAETRHAVDRLLVLAQNNVVTLVYSAQDVEQSSTKVLYDYLSGKLQVS